MDASPAKQIQNQQQARPAIQRSKSMRLTAKRTASKDDWGRPPAALIPSLCVYHFLIIGIVFAAYVWLDDLASTLLLDASFEYKNLEQLRHDWNKPLIKSIKVLQKDANQILNCPSNHTELFVKQWKGLEGSCNCIQ